MNDSCYHISGWLVEPHLNRISKKQASLQLEPRTMRLLVFLIEHADQVITRERIFDEIWPNMEISDESLTRAISDLRKALGDNPVNPHVIDTIRTVGYRLVAPVKTTSSNTKQKISKPSRLILGVMFLVIAALIILLWQQYSTSFSVVKPEHVKPFTSDYGLEFYPAFSHNGEMVAFNRSDLDDKRRSTLVIKPLAKNKPQISIGGIQRHHPAWSPNDKHIAYFQLINNQCEIFILNVSTQKESHLSNCPGSEPAHLLWTPDNKHLLINGKDPASHQWQLWLMNITSPHEVETLKFAKRASGFSLPRFSKSGALFSYLELEHEGGLVSELKPVKGTIKIINWADKTLISALEIDRELFGYDWSTNDDSLIYAASDDGNNYQLWRNNMAGLEKPILATERAFRNPVVSATGKIIVESWNSNKDINIWSIAANKLTQNVNSTRWDFEPNVNTDQTMMAYISTRTGATEIWLRDLASSTDSQLTRGDGIYSQPNLSPHNQKLVYVVKKLEEQHLYTMNIDGTNIQQLTQLPGQQQLPFWSADSRYIYFTSNHSGKWQLWRTETTSGDTEKVTVSGGYSAKEVLTQNGQQLYFINFESRQLWKKDLVTGIEQQVTAQLIPSFSGWDINQHTLYWLDRKMGMIELHSLHLKSGQKNVTDILKTEMQTSLLSLQMAKDGSQIIFTVVDNLTGDLMLVSEY